MEQQLDAPSEAAIVLMRDNLLDFGQSIFWRNVDADLADNISKTIKAYIEPGLVPFYVINGSATLSRITVFNQQKEKLIDVKIVPQPMGPVCPI